MTSVTENRKLRRGRWGRRPTALFDRTANEIGGRWHTGSRLRQ